MTDSELQTMRNQHDAYELECDYYQDSYMKVLADKLAKKIVECGTLHDDDTYEDVH